MIAAQVGVIGRKFQIKKRRLALLKLCRRRQHVMGQSGRLGHGHVDHDQKFQLGEGIAIGARSAPVTSGLPLSTNTLRMHVDDRY